MKKVPTKPKQAPAIVYGQRVTSLTPGTILPKPMLTASAVRPVRHQARYVRSFASLVRRVASVDAASSRPATSGAGLLRPSDQQARAIEVTNQPDEMHQ